MIKNFTESVANGVLLQLKTTEQDSNLAANNETSNPVTSGIAVSATPLYSDEQVQLVQLACNILFFGLLVFSTIGNVFNFCVLTCTRYKARSSVRYYMLATSVADLLTLWLGVPRSIFNISLLMKTGLAAWITRHQDPIEATYCLLEGGQLTFMSLSDWILVAFSFERLLILVSPFRFGFLQRPTAARIIIAVLTVVSLVFSLFQYMKGYVAFTAATVPEWLVSWSNIQRVADMIGVPLTFFLILLPSVALIIFLTKQRKSDVCQLRMQNSNTSSTLAATHRKLAAASSGNSKLNARSQMGTNLLLLGSAAFYTVTRLPFVIYLFLDPAVYTDLSPFMLAKPLMNLTILLGYTFNFFVYIASDVQFREHFVKLILQPIAAHCNRFRRQSTANFSFWSSGNQHRQKPFSTPTSSKALLTATSSV
ncbi:uncharacterized protein LOC129602755 [Paramacrobiotus metropolitanus]|uniref:uncharacterized protein LOC129602755 n=1 Tax=Paramacrobiotus metropolitanus TaxID=2943436 RepID=UPI002445A67E|nr:uncharacterized protein LOC129602755 [Paramacrobiotus metropolitanus]